MSKKKKIKKHSSPAPIYVIAFLWLFWGIFFDFYKPIHFVACGIVSLLAFIIAKAIWPAKPIPEQARTEEEHHTKTGDPEIDKMMEDRDNAINEMYRLKRGINNEKISEQIKHLQMVTAKIMTHVIEHPEKKKQVRRFFNYYLPTTLKLLNTYDQMDDIGVSGENIDSTMSKVEAMMDNAVEAFDRQFDALFAGEALDISSDISVMENLMKREGLVNGISEEEIKAREAVVNDSQITIEDILKDRTEETEKVTIDN